MPPDFACNNCHVGLLSMLAHTPSLPVTLLNDYYPSIKVVIGFVNSNLPDPDG